MPADPPSALLSSGSFPRRELFRTAQLNAVGWATMSGLCLTGAAIGLVVTRFTGVPSWVTTPIGGAAAFVAVLSADRRKWGATSASHVWTEDPIEVHRIASQLQRAGVEASVENDEFERPTLRYFNRDQHHVARAFSDAGLPPPPPS